MFEQKYGVQPTRFLFWLGLYLATGIIAYMKLYNDAPVAFWIVLIVENVMSIGIGLDQLMDEAMEEINEGPVVWVMLIGTGIGSIMFIAMFLINLELALILALVEIMTLAFHKVKNNQHT